MIKTPQNQQRMTNVAVVKMKKGGKKFEIATYPNKVLAWRQKLEKDLDEVLQSEQIYTNVSRGETAKVKDLKKCFGTDDLGIIVEEILLKGQIQESEKERERALETTFKEIAAVVVDKCVHAETNRPLTIGFVERVMRDMHFAVKPEDSAKKQALKLIGVLQDSEFPIRRAYMLVQVRVPNMAEATASVKAIILEVTKDIVNDEQHTMVCLVEPGKYRQLDEVVKKELQGEIEVLQLAVREESEAELGRLMEHTQIGEAPASKAEASEKKVKIPDAGFRTGTAPGVVFPTREAMREHMKSDWHKFNLKMKTSGKEMLTEEQFVEQEVDTVFFG